MFIKDKDFFNQITRKASFGGTACTLFKDINQFQMVFSLWMEKTLGMRIGVSSKTFSNPMEK